MFANLKKKIEDGGTDLTKELSQANSKPNNSVALGRGVESPLLPRRNLSDSSRQQYGSNESLMSDTSIQNEATTSIGRVFEASLSNILGSPSKDFEVKVREMTKLLKEEITKRKKVERVLEKQQDLLVARIEEKEEEWKEKTTSLVKDNEQLKRNLSDANIRLERVAKSQDAVEELENFQIQEISKLKHLLLVGEQQLKLVTDDLKLKENDLDSKIQAIDRLTHENNKFKERLLLEDRDLSRKSDIDMVLECKQQLEEERNKFANLENGLSKFQEQISALTSENETLKQENSKVLQLEECVKSLENEINLLRVQENLIKTRNEKLDEINSLNMNGNANILENNLALQDENVNKHFIKETKRSRELDHLNEKLENVEKLLKLSQESEERAKEFSQLWEEKSSKYSLERDSLLQLNEQLKSELNLIKENLKKTQCELELSVDQVKQLTDELSSSEAEKQNLIDMLAEFRESVKDAQNANNEASRLETLTMNLQDQITEKNKAIKLQQQQINDMKKALHRELRLQTVDSNSNDSNEKNFHPKFSASVLGFSRDRPASLSEKLDEVNFKYVKHVVLKYMTSTESEAQHLIRAIGVLLDFTGEEEDLVRQTIDWKMSWFGSKPQPSRLHIGNRTIVS